MTVLIPDAMAVPKMVPTVPRDEASNAPVTEARTAAVTCIPFVSSRGRAMPPLGSSAFSLAPEVTSLYGLYDQFLETV